jgi:hypothetical protein
VNKRRDHMKIKVFSVGTGSLVERCIVRATGQSRGLSSVQQCFSPVNSKGNLLWYSVRNTLEQHLYPNAGYPDNQLTASGLPSA